MRVADTSVLFAFFNTEDAHHARAVELVGDEDPIFVPSEILVELIDLISYRLGHAEARKALADLLGLPHVSIAPRASIAAARAIFEEARGRLSLADAILLQTCRELGATALSFDRAIIRRSSQ